MKWDDIQAKATKWEDIQPAPVSDQEYVPIPPVVTEPTLTERFTRAGLQVPRLFAQVMGGAPVKTIMEPGKMEAAATMASGMLAEPVAGVTGMGALALGKTPEQAEAEMEMVKETMTYQPRLEAGREELQAAGEAMEPIAEVVNAPAKWLGDTVADITGSPAAATVAYTAPYAALEFLGLKGLQRIRPGTRLIDEYGKPTKALRKQLDKQGLIYEELSPQAKEMIPETIEPGLISTPKPATSAEKALVAQIKAGGREDALAGLRVIGDRVGVDKLGKEAIRQGFEPGVVQAVKTATPETKFKMAKMLNRMRAIKKSAREAKHRPSDIAGDALTDRIKFIRNKAEIARKKLNEIARLKLRGKDIDINQINRALQEELDNLNIRVEMQDGIPKPIYTGSQISKNPNAQRAIDDLIDLMAEGGRPDALRAHNLKRQLDELIDFNKKSAEGLTDAGRNILKRMRRELNDSIRDVDPDYAQVNDTLSKSLDAFGQLDDAVGTIDIFGARSDAALGTRLRTLTSNYASRQKLENALDAIDTTVKDLGGKFNDDLYDLNMFANELDRQFGAVAKTSLAGQVEQATARAVREGPTRSMWEKGAEMAGKAAEKARGINEFNAFESLDALLKRK